MTRFWEETNTAIPIALNSSNEWYSPCPDSRDATPPHDSSTVAIPATANSMSSVSDSLSIASASETIDAGWSKRQIAHPSIAANPTIARIGITRSRTSGLRSSPTSSSTQPCRGRHQDRRQRRPVDVRALDLGGGDERDHREATVVTFCEPDTVGSLRLSRNCG